MNNSNKAALMHMARALALAAAAILAVHWFLD